MANSEKPRTYTEGNPKPVFQYCVLKFRVGQTWAAEASKFCMLSDHFQGGSWAELTPTDART